MKKRNVHGGGSQTNVNGLNFENETDLIKLFKKNRDFVVSKKNYLYEIIYKNKKYGFYTEKHDFYKYLNDSSIDWKTILSKQYLPDAVFLNMLKKKAFIIEKKFQNNAGSVDEKLQTCDFKKKIYQKLLLPTKNFKTIEYIYILNDFFNHQKYDDVKKYIKSVGCKYFMNFIEFRDLDID